MSGVILTVFPPNKALEERSFAADSVGARAPDDSLKVEILDGNDVVLGEVIVEREADDWVEVVSPDGSLQWQEAPAPLSLDLADEFGAAKSARIVGYERHAQAQISLARLTSRVPIVWRGNLQADADYRITLIADRFADKDRFWATCASFEAALESTPPFNQEHMRNKIGIVGLWYPQTVEGILSTRVTTTRRLEGNNRLALELANQYNSSTITLVVVDWPNWLGAGGIAGRRPAYSTNYNLNQQWTGLALHEIGHSIGLADEYSETGPIINYQEAMPNVTNDRNAHSCKWHHSITPEIFHDPTQGHEDPSQHPSGTIGTFEGALYKKQGLYRPTSECKMRNTQKEFCPVCQSHIRQFFN